MNTKHTCMWFLPIQILSFPHKKTHWRTRYLMKRTFTASPAGLKIQRKCGTSEQNKVCKTYFTHNAHTHKVDCNGSPQTVSESNGWECIGRIVSIIILLLLSSQCAHASQYDREIEIEVENVWREAARRNVLTGERSKRQSDTKYSRLVSAKHKHIGPQCIRFDGNDKKAHANVSPPDGIVAFNKIIEGKGQIMNSSWR